MSFLDQVRERGAFRIENSEDRPLTIMLKPWGQELELAPNMAVEVFFVGDSAMSENLSVAVAPGGLELTVKDESMAFFRMRGSAAPAKKAPKPQLEQEAERYYSAAAE